MKKKIGMWEMQVEAPRFIDRELVEELERFLNQEWRQVVLKTVNQPWGGLEYFNILSPIIRVDMAPVVNPKAIIGSIYEIEIRPGGLGVMSLLVPERLEQWKKVLSSCQCKGFIKIKSSIQDDKLAAELLGIPYYEYEEAPNKLEEGFYWIRSNTTTGKIIELEKYSLVPIRMDGDKNYLVKLKMAELLTQERLNWSSPFVVKPLVGSRMEGVEIYLPSSLRKKFGHGFSTKSQVIRAISQEAPYMVQKFIMPQPEEMNGLKGWTIWRLFFGWQGNYTFLGGLWNWRPNLRVHGASDAIFGVIEVET